METINSDVGKSFSCIRGENEKQWQTKDALRNKRLTDFDLESSALKMSIARSRSPRGLHWTTVRENGDWLWLLPRAEWVGRDEGNLVSLSGEELQVSYEEFQHTKII